MLRKVISGGQTGVDRGALEAAMALGVEVGGWCPKGRRAEDGRIPDRYSLVECDSPNYPVRTRLNVEQANGTLILVGPPRGTAKGLSPGSRLTLEIAQRSGKPHMCMAIDSFTVERLGVLVAEFVIEDGIGVLNVAGTRESKAPGIQARAALVVGLALGRLRAEGVVAHG